MDYVHRVVCAANWVVLEYEKVEVHLEGFLLVGPRHWGETMHNQYKLITKTLPQPVRKADEVQGFIDQHGVFLTRQEAWKVAEDAGQIIHRVGGDTLSGGTLYSENLY